MENYPFFKFHPGEWREGDISFLPLETQGLFINICSLFWIFSGRLSWPEVSKRLPTAKRADYDRLITDHIIEEIDGQIKVSFLQKQIDQCHQKSAKNSENGREGAKKKNELLAVAKQTLSIGQANGKRPKSERLANGKQKEREEKRRKRDSNTTVGSSVTYSEASNGYANSDTPSALWGRVSSKANLSAEVKAEAEPICLEWIEKMFVHPDKEKMLQKLRDLFKINPDLFADDVSEITGTFEMVYENIAQPS